MSDNVEVGRYFTAPDGLRVTAKVPVYPEAEGYLKNIRKDVDHADLNIKNYARLLETNTIQLIAGEITIEVFAEISPNNLDIAVSHLNYMRDAIIRTWNLRSERLARMEKEQGEIE
jgi:hypothetical protein